MKKAAIAVALFVPKNFAKRKLSNGNLFKGLLFRAESSCFYNKSMMTLLIN